MNSPTRTMPRANEDEALAPGPITLLRTQLEQRAVEFAMVLPSHITPEKLQRTILTAAQANPDLLKCDRRSFLTSCMKAAQDGLLPDGREAAIVPFNTRMKVAGEWKFVKLAQYMPMVFGLRKKILQSGEIADIFAAVVYRQEIEAGRFIYEEGTERMLRHKPILEPDFRPADDDIAAAYSVATFTNGFKSFEVMRRYEINEVRETSQIGAQFDAKGEPRDAKGPWVEWFGEMAKKTVIRRHSKSLPQSSDIIVDVEAEDMAFASRSALALLEGTKADAPKPVLADTFADKSGTFAEEGFDQETGELTGEGGTFDDEVKDEPEPEPKPEAPKRRGRPPKAQGTDLAAPPDAPPSASEEAVKESVSPAAPETDEFGVTKTAEEIRAEAYIARAQNCEFMIDLRTLEREAEMDLAEMPVHIASCVDTEFDKARKRLNPRRNSENEG